MITLTGWNDQHVYVNPIEVAAVEPVATTESWMALSLTHPHLTPPTGTVITLAAGRTINVREDAAIVHERVRDASRSFAVRADPERVTTFEQLPDWAANPTAPEGHL
ncbi:hypothetical protein ACFWPK_22255 [Nocardia sp. NPDC058519]|uniref:hypothetical protein n=1 Tax=Nocardia sp. NPDC058519 TaxID=3346535 RepID=UPI00365C15C3